MVRPRSDGLVARYPGTIQKRSNGKFTAVAPAEVEDPSDPNSRKVRRALGTKETWAQAEKLLAEHAGIAATGRAAFKRAATPYAAKPIDLFLELYLEERRREVAEGKLERRSYTDLAAKLRYAMFDLGFNGHNDLERLSTDDVAQWVRDLYTKGSTYHRSKGPLTVGTAKKTLFALHAAMEVAVRNGDIERNPAKLPKSLFPVDTPDYGDGSEGEEGKRWPTMDELNTFLDHVSHCPMKWGSGQFALWKLAAESGMRCGELAGVSKNDIDWEEGTLSIKRALGLDLGVVFAKMPKSRNGIRTIGLTPGTMNALRAYLGHVALHSPVILSDSRGVGTVSLDLFFRNEDGSCLNPTNVSQGFLYEWKHAGLGKGISIHSLRHLHASRLLEGDDKKGIKPQDLTWVAERLGDHEATIAKTYAHILDKNARARRGVDDISALYAAS